MPNPIDVQIGAAIRQRRRDAAMSQEQLAKRLGTTLEQVQKFETGANRVSASRLWRISIILSVPVEQFFAGLPREV